MNILIVIPSYKPAFVYGGPIYSVSRLAEALVQIGNSVTVYTTNANGAEDLNITIGESVDVDGVNVLYFKRWTRGHSNFSPTLLLRLIKNAKKFDVIHIQSWWNLVTVPAAWICLLLGKAPMISPRGTLTYYTIYHKGQFFKSIFHNWIGAKLLERSVLCFTTIHEYQEAKKLTRTEKYFVLPNILDLQDPRLVIRKAEESLQILFLGRIDPAKNLELVIEALSSDLDFNYQWKIAGEGDEGYIKVLKEKAKNLHDVQWLGAITGEAKYNLLAEADLLVLPSHTENFGNVVLEALSQGTPVLLSPHVGIGDYVIRQKLGFVVEDNPERWRSELRTMALDKSRLLDIRRIASGVIQRDFEPRVLAKKYQEAYQKVINNDF